MKAKDTSGLFEMAKKAPAELSKEAVLDFIKLIPTLPSPSTNWFQNFNLNSIIMTTTAITLVTSAVLYFSLSTDKQELVLPTKTELSVPMPIGIIDTFKESGQTKLVITTIDTISKKTSVKPMADIALPTKEEAPDSPEETTNQTSSKKESIKKPDTANAIKLSFGNEMNAGKATEFDIKKETKKVSLSGTELRELKSQLTKYVKEDKLYFGKNQTITLEFYKDSLQIRYTKIEEPKLSKYLKVLAKYNISPGPYRKIIIDKKYIMAGDFTNEGFEGSALGRAMEITFKESKGTISSIKDGIFKARNGQIRQISFSPTNGPKHTGGLIFQKAETQKGEESELNVGSPLFSMSSEILNQSYAFRRHLKTSDRAASIFDEDHRDRRIIVSTRRLKSLRRELYKQLISDQLVEKKGNPVRISLEPSTFSINNQALSPRLEKKYLKLLSKFRIRPGQFNKLLLSADFVVVGAFENSKFHGSVMGNIETEKVLGSILEDDFKGITIFGFDKAMKKD